MDGWLMLWIDESSRTLAQKIQIALDYYARKYNRVPNLCYVRPDALKEIVSIEGVSVRPDKLMLPDCMTIGVEEKP